MVFLLRRIFFASLCLGGAAVLTACGGLDRVSGGIVGMVPVYKVGVVQGNFISKEQVAALQPGMARQQVADLLGTPLLASVFHADRWDYAFTMKNPGVEPVSRKLTVFFKGDSLERFEGDEMVTEAEFAAQFAPPKKSNKAVPTLEASEEVLKAFAPAAAKAPEATPAAAATPAPATVYPPLEPPPR